MAKASDEWLLGAGFHMSDAKDIETDGQQAGEVAFHGESLMGGRGPGWEQSVTPGSSTTRSGRKIGVRMDVNGYGGGIKSKRFPDGQANSNDLNRATGHGEPTAEEEDTGTDTTLDNVSPPSGHSTRLPGYGKTKTR